jgi:hypothetical protein
MSPTSANKPTIFPITPPALLAAPIGIGLQAAELGSESHAQPTDGGAEKLEEYSRVRQRHPSWSPRRNNV